LFTILLLNLSYIDGNEGGIPAAKRQLVEAFNQRRYLSGDDSYPSNYRQDAMPQECCAGNDCVECMMERASSVQAVTTSIQQEIELLRDLGCPCRIASLMPSFGSISGGTQVVVRLSGIDLDMAFALGPIECWVKRAPEVYDKLAATRIAASEVTCTLKPMREGTTDIWIHSDLFTIKAGANSFLYINDLTVSTHLVQPKASPVTGRITLTVHGTNFPLHDVFLRDALRCMFRGITFDALLLDNVTATCVTPVLPRGRDFLALTYNGIDLIPNTSLPFAVYNHPLIVGMWPETGFSGEVLSLQASGFGYDYVPQSEDLLCRFLQPHQNKTVVGMRVDNTSTIECRVPNNTRDDHLISGQVHIELSLIGWIDEAFSDHKSSQSNVFLYKCQDEQTVYSDITLAFFPNCTAGFCCSAGFVSDGEHCQRCPAGTFSGPGSYRCLDCPANSSSPAGSPSPRSCVCDEGFVGSSGGVLKLPWDQCVLCAEDEYAFLSPLRTVENQLSKTIHTLAEYPVSASCMRCPPNSRSPRGGRFEADCECRTGYMCMSDGIPCYLRLAYAYEEWGRRTCQQRLPNDRNVLLTEYEVQVEARAGVVSSSLSVCRGHGQGDMTAFKPCDPCDLTGEHSQCACTCANSPGYAANQSAHRCEDVDECAVNATICLDVSTSPGQPLQCNNIYGDYECLCPAGYKVDLSMGGACTDIDECSEGINSCHDDAVCVNTPGSFLCHCRRGFVGDGVIDCWNGKKECVGALEVNIDMTADPACPKLNASGILPLEVNATNMQNESEVNITVNEGNITAGNSSGLNLTSANVTWNHSETSSTFNGTVLNETNSKVSRSDWNKTWSNLSNSSAQADEGESLFHLCCRSPGTRDPVFMRFHWLQTQTWSEEVSISRHLPTTVGSNGSAVLSGFRYVGNVSMVEYRVEGNDDWRPSSIRLRLYNADVWLNLSSSLCWVGSSASPAAACVDGNGTCGSMQLSARVDVDECASGFHSCHQDSSCQNEEGRYRCDCLAGYYGTGRSMLGPGTSCLPCPTGTFAPSSATSCITCPDVYSTTREDRSTLLSDCYCLAGYYGTLSLNESCSLCPLNHFCPVASAHPIPCPPDSSSPAGTREVTDCVCNPGFVGRNGGRCTICLPGSVCEGGWIDPLVCPEGTYSMQAQTACSQCVSNSSSLQGQGTCMCDPGFHHPDYFQLSSNSTCGYRGCSVVSSEAKCYQAAAALLRQDREAYPNYEGYYDSQGGCFLRPAPNISNSSTGNETNSTWIESSASFVPPVNDTNSSSSSSSSMINISNLTNVSPPSCSPDSPCVCEACAPPVCLECPAATFAEQGATACLNCPPAAVSPAMSGQETDCLCLPGFHGLASSYNASCSFGVSQRSPCVLPFYWEGRRYVDCTFDPPPASGGASGGGGGDFSWCALSTMENGTVKDWDWCSCELGCQPCRAGSFTSELGTLLCSSCPAGSYANHSRATACELCPANTTSQEGSVSLLNCSCLEGYERIADGTCKDVDECLNASSCPSSSFCVNLLGSFRCDCRPGFYSNASSCLLCPAGFSCNGSQAQLPCPAGSFAPPGSSSCSSCPPQSLSPEAAGAVEACLCLIGFANNETGNASLSSSSSCVNVDECAGGIDDCNQFATCEDTWGSFSCFCLLGTYGDGVTCVSRCGDGLRGAEETCDDLNNRSGDGCSSSCSQEPGWTCSPRGEQNATGAGETNLTGGGNSSLGDVCEDVNECELGLDTCALNASCVNTVGSFLCECFPGFHGNGSVCDHCPPHSDSPLGSQLMSNCSCDAGWRRPVAPSSSAEEWCVDLNECEAEPVCGNFSSCNNTVGSFVCLCDVGYEHTTSDSDCVDIDECARGLAGCDTSSVCSNTRGSFECLCQLGYSSEGANLTNTTCAKCEEGKYSDQLAATSCSPCPQNSTSSRGSTSISQCFCEAGYAGLISQQGGSCLACPAGTFSLAGWSSCCSCPEGSTSEEASASPLACVCDVGYFETPWAGLTSPSSNASNASNASGSESFNVSGASNASSTPNTSLDSSGTAGGQPRTCPAAPLQCSRCPPFASSPLSSKNASACFCIPGYYLGPPNGTRAGGVGGVNGSNSSSAPNLTLSCVPCPSCLPGYHIVGCGSSSPGECMDIDECASSPCAPEGSRCLNYNGSFRCECAAGYYGDGYMNCSRCPDPNADSPAGSTELSNCSCMAGFLTVDGVSPVLTEQQHICYGYVELLIRTWPVTAEEDSCWQGQYSREQAGTLDDVWVRVGWSDNSSTRWFSLYSERRPSPYQEDFVSVGFNFSLGSESLAILSSLERIGGEPVQVEYLLQGNDAWRPSSFLLRINNYIATGIYSTQGHLRWVDGNSASSISSNSTCYTIRPSALVQLYKVSNASNTTQDVAFGLPPTKPRTVKEGGEGGKRGMYTIE